MYRDLPLHWKLFVMMGALQLCISAGLLVIFPPSLVSVARTGIEKRATSAAQVFANAAAPLLEFGDTNNVEQLLQSLALDKEVECAGVRNADGSIFAAIHGERLPRLAATTGGAPTVLQQYQTLYAVAEIHAKGGTTGTLILGYSLADLELEKARSLSLVTSVSGIILLIGLLVSFFMGRYLSTPIRNLTEIAADVVRTRDLTHRVEALGNDEVGRLTQSFAAMMHLLSVAIKTLMQVADGISAVLAETGQAASIVNSSSMTVRSQIAESATAMSDIQSMLYAFAADVASLNNDTEKGATANVRMGELNTELAESVDAMINQVQSGYRAIELMLQSVSEVSSSIGQINTSISEVSQAISQVNRSTVNVEEVAQNTARIAEQVSVNAHSGVTAITQTLEGIGRISNASETVYNVIGELARRIDSISEIVRVIDDVANQTNLLALNASIIAAQAGVNGKGFAVVADEIKALAKRTGDSTEQIGTFIHDILIQSTKAQQAAEHSTNEVRAGVDLGNQAAVALERISDSANEATAMAHSIAVSTKMQTRSSEQVSNSVQRIAAALQHATHASVEQSANSTRLRDIAGNIKNATEHLRQTNQQQTLGGMQIAQSVQSINKSAGDLAASQQKQTLSAEQVGVALNIVSENSDHQLAAIGRLEESIEVLRLQAGKLKAEIAKFKVN